MHHAGSSSLLSVMTFHEQHSQRSVSRRPPRRPSVPRRAFQKTLRSSTIVLLLLVALGVSTEAFSATKPWTTRTRRLLSPGRRSVARSSSSRTTTTTSTQTQLDMFLLSDVAEGYHALLETHPLLTASITAGCLSGLGDVIAQIQQQQQQQQYEQAQSEEEDDLSQPLLVASSESLDMDASAAWTLPSGSNHSRSRTKLSMDPERLVRFILKGLGGGLIWLAWYHVADDLTQRLLSDSNHWFHHSSADASGSGSSSDAMMTMAGGATGTEGSSSSTVATTTTATAMVCRTLLSILLDQFLASPLVLAMWEIPVPILLASSSSSLESIDHQDVSSSSPFQKIRSEVRDKLGSLLVENAKVWTVANMIIYNLPFEYRVLASSCTDVVWQSILSRNVNVMVDATTTADVESSSSSSSSSPVGYGNVLEEDLEAVLLPTTSSSSRRSRSSTLEEEIVAIV